MPKEKLNEEAVNNENAGVTQAHYEELAAKSAENQKQGLPHVEIDLIATHNVKFIKNFGYMKKGTVTTVSDTAYNIYHKAGAVEKA